MENTNETNNTQKSLEELMGRYFSFVEEVNNKKQENIFAKSFTWEQKLEYQMCRDPNAAVAILSYYLEKKVGMYCTIYCPLGYEPYEVLGTAMAEDPDVFMAAKKTGLLAEGVSHYLEGALSNIGCWHCMEVGVAYMLRNEELREFMPYRQRFIAEGLVRLTPNTEGENEDDEWSEAWDLVKKQLKNKMKGY